MTETEFPIPLELEHQVLSGVGHLYGHDKIALLYTTKS